MSLFDGRRRKLLLGVAALGILLAVLVGLLLAPAGGRDDSVRITLERTTTNNANVAYACFFVTNAGKKAAHRVVLDSEIRTNHQWSHFSRSGLIIGALDPGHSRSVDVLLPPDGRVWRGKAVWFSQPTKLQTGRYWLATKTGSVFPSLKPDLAHWQSKNTHTNYSAEFQR